MNEGNFEMDKKVLAREAFLDEAGLGKEALVHMTGHDVEFLDKLMSGKFTPQEVDAYEASESKAEDERKAIVEALIGGARMIRGEGVNPVDEMPSEERAAIE